MAGALKLLALVAALGCATGAPAATAGPQPIGPAALTIYSVPNPSLAGRQVMIAGRVPGAGAGTRVTLWERPADASTLTRVASTTTSGIGQYSFARAPNTNAAWIVTALGFQSAAIDERVVARVTLQAVPAGSALRFSGYVRPSHAGEQLVLQRYAGGRWRVFARPRLDLSSGFLTARPLGVPADVRALLPGNATNARSISEEVLAVGATPGPSSALGPNFFGLNWNYEGAALFSSDLPGEYAALAALRPGTLRWPGGSVANYFQWKLGYPLDVGEQNGFRDTIGDLAAAYQATGAAPVFDLNVMTSDMANQEQLLFAAQAAGVPIKYVELGNELYFSRPDDLQYFPTAASYGQTVAAYVIALHSDFAGVLVAADGAAGGGPPRYVDWNSEMLSAAEQADGPPDAIALHIKPGWVGPFVRSDLPSLFAAPYFAAQLANATIAAFPQPEPAWLTEYNLYPEFASNGLHGLYAHMLVEAEDSLLLLTIRHVTLADYWTTFSTSPNAAYIPSATGAPALTPAGLALEWIQTAAAGATTSTPITFSGPRLWRGRFSALVGTQFSGGRDVIVNLSPRNMIVPAGAAIQVGLPYKQVGGDPMQRAIYATQLSVTTGTVGAALVLPPYSVTAVG